MPHRSLRLDNLSKLPVSYRRLASAAVNGTVLNLQEFLGLCVTAPYSQPKLFLPVFFANLDPARIPSLAQLDSISRGIDSPIALALLSLRALITGRESFELPAEASLDVWPRVWKWMHFLDTYRDLFPESADKETYSLYLTTILDLQKHQETKDLIDATPGVRVVVARAWAFFVGLDACVGEAGFHDVCLYLLNDLKPSNPANIAELIEGVSGTVADLASVIVRHMNHIIASSKIAVFYFEGIIGILDKMDTNSSLKKALLSAGIVKALMHMINFLAGTRTPDPAGVLNDCFTILSRIFTTYPAPMCIPAALRAGILNIICVCTVAHPTLREHMQHLVQQILPPALIYHSVVARVEDAIYDAGEAAMDPRFKASSIFQDWAKFVQLTKERVRFARAYDAGEYPSRTACNSSTCTNVQERRDMKRCGSCRRLYYCSAECQSLHWEQGGHRMVCRRLKALRISDPEPLSTRDRSFMRALARHDYLEALPTILMDELEVLHVCRGMPYYFLFDYTAGAANIEILSTEAVEVPPVPSNFQGQWLDHVARSASSGGRMQVAIMRFLQGGVGRFQMISMHTPSTVVLERLCALFEGIPEETEFGLLRAQFEGRVRALVPLVDVVI
ncbi:hypothetical protein DFH06DRAFT_1249139 [Mycena polygramma]|nr:hypothetical protein DFH06DRAFT_1249139 [Mycena polygramma]